MMNPSARFETIVVSSLEVSSKLIPSPLGLLNFLNIFFRQWFNQQNIIYFSIDMKWKPLDEHEEFAVLIDNIKNRFSLKTFHVFSIYFEHFEIFPNFKKSSSKGDTEVNHSLADTKEDLLFLEEKLDLFVHQVQEHQHSLKCVWEKIFFLLWDLFDLFSYQTLHIYSLIQLRMSTVCRC